MATAKDDETENWGRGVVSPDIVSFSDDAKAKIMARASTVEDDQVLALIWVLSSSNYDRDGNLQETRGSHVGMGTHYRSQIPEKYIIELWGIDIYLRIDPHHGETPLKSAKLWIEDGRFESVFDPPAPMRTRTFPKRIEDQPGYRDKGRLP